MQLESIFVGQPQVVEFQGREISTSIFKEEISGPVFVNTLNIEGDKQADLTVHGGVEKAVYMYPSEHYDYWKRTRPDLSFEKGTFGENLSTTGIMEEDINVGDIIQIGEAVFQVTGPRMPCFKLGIKMGDNTIIKDFLNSERNGFYLKVNQEGIIHKGDRVKLIEKSEFSFQMKEFIQAYHSRKTDRELLERAVEAPQMPEDWRVYFIQKLRGLSK